MRLVALLALWGTLGCYDGHPYAECSINAVASTGDSTLRVTKCKWYSGTFIWSFDSTTATLTWSRGK